MADIGDSWVKIDSLLSYDWSDFNFAVTDDNVKQVAKEFEGLQNSDVQPLLDTISDKLFTRWAENLVGKFGSAMNGQEKYDIFYKFAESLNGKSLARVTKTFLKFESDPDYKSGIVRKELYPALLSQAAVRPQIIEAFIEEMTTYYIQNPDSVSKEQFDQLVAANAAGAPAAIDAKAVGNVQRKLQYIVDNGIRDNPNAPSLDHTEAVQTTNALIQEINTLGMNDRNALFAHLSDATIAGLGAQVGGLSDWTKESGFFDALSPGLNPLQMSRVAANMAQLDNGDELCSSLYTSYFGQVKSNSKLLSDFTQRMEIFYANNQDAHGKKAFHNLYQ